MMQRVFSAAFTHTRRRCLAALAPSRKLSVAVTVFQQPRLLMPKEVTWTGVANRSCCSLRAAAAHFSSYVGASTEEEEGDAIVYLAEEELQQQYHSRIVRRLENDAYDAAVEVYEEMLMDCVKPLPDTLVEIIFYSPTISDALDVLQDSIRGGDRPSVLVYNEILRRCSDAKLQYTALRLLQEMERFNIEPDVDTYCWIIRTIGRAKRNNHKVAYDFAMDVIHKTGMYVPDRMYLELLKACKLRGSMPMVRKIMDTVFEGGTAPTAAIFNAAMGCSSRNGAIDYAFELFDRMLDMGIRPTSSSYCLLITSINEKCRSPQDNKDLLVRACTLFRQMLTEEIPPTVEACKAVESIGAQIGDEEAVLLAQEAREIVESLLEDNME